MNSIKLKKPIKIDGKEVTELTYDCDEITVQMYLAANSKKSGGSHEPNITVKELDNSLHLYLGFYGIIAANKDIDITDLERIKGIDISAIADIGRNFIIGTQEESAESSSDVPSETIPEPSTLPKAI